MGLRNNTYAKVFKVNNDDKTPSMQISISRKNKQTGEYVTTFSGYVSCKFAAKDKLASVNDGDRIRILDCDLENRYNKETKETRWYPSVLDFEMADGSPIGTPAVESFEELDDEDVPF